MSSTATRFHLLAGMVSRPDWFTAEERAAIVDEVNDVAYAEDTDVETLVASLELIVAMERANQRLRESKAYMN
jgi:hypothetical protein